MALGSGTAADCVDPTSRRRRGYSAIGACSGRSRTGAHQRRMARPTGASNGDHPGCAGIRLSEESGSNSVAGRSWVTTPWQCASSKGVLGDGESERHGILPRGGRSADVCDLNQTGALAGPAQAILAQPACTDAGDHLLVIVVRGHHRFGTVRGRDDHCRTQIGDHCPAAAVRVNCAAGRSSFGDDPYVRSAAPRSTPASRPSTIPTSTSPCWSVRSTVPTPCRARASNNRGLGWP